VLGSCQKVAIDGNEDGGKESKTGEKVTLTVNVNQIELVPFGDISAAKQAFSDVTRTTNVAEACHHLCFALYKDGKRVKYANQNVGSENFGTVTFSLMTILSLLMWLVCVKNWKSRAWENSRYKGIFKNLWR